MGKQQRLLYIVLKIMLLPLVLLTTTACATLFSGQTQVVTPTPEIVYSTIMPPAQPLSCSGQPSQTTTFVTAQGTQLLYRNAPLRLYGYTFYPALIGGSKAWRKPDFTHYIDHVLNMGKATGQNLIRPTDFWDAQNISSPQENVIIWQNLDYLVCTAKQRGLFVAMDISALAHWLTSQHQDPYNARNWTAFVRAVGKHYANQSSIAFYSVLGEPPPPKTKDEMHRLVDFYRAVTDELANVDGGHHLITAGGFNHMEDESPHIPWWHTIYQLPHNTLIAFKTYSQKDIQLLPTITTFAGRINKPALDEEFGLPQNMGDAVYTGAPYNNIQVGRAQFYQQVYSLGELHALMGFIFWNMGCELKGGSYEVNPNTPAVWTVIQSHAPVPPDPSISTSNLCPPQN